MMNEISRLGFIMQPPVNILDITSFSQRVGCKKVIFVYHFPHIPPNRNVSFVGLYDNK